MMVLSPDNFGTQAADECVRSLQVRLQGQIGRWLRSQPDSFEELSRLTDNVVVYLELVGLIAEHAYRAAVQHRPDCDALLVPPHVIDEWAEQLTRSWERFAALGQEHAASVTQCRKAVGDGFGRVRAISEQQWKAREQRRTISCT